MTTKAKHVCIQCGVAAAFEQAYPDGPPSAYDGEMAVADAAAWLLSQLDCGGDLMFIHRLADQLIRYRMEQDGIEDAEEEREGATVQ